MRWRLYFLVALFTLVLAGGMVGPVLALNSNQFLNYSSQVGLTVGDRFDVVEKPILKLVGNVIKTLLSFIGVIFFVFVLYAGFLWMTSGGNEEKVTTAMHILFQSVVGLLIVVFAYSITVLVVDIIFGVQYPSDLPDTTTYTTRVYP